METDVFGAYLKAAAAMEAGVGSGSIEGRSKGSSCKFFKKLPFQGFGRVLFDSTAVLHVNYMRSSSNIKCLVNTSQYSGDGE